MTSKHSITCIALSAAVALKLFAETANAAVLNDGNQAAGSTGRPIIVTDISNPIPAKLGSGIDIASVDGQIVNS
jgi:hypothetical protein